MHDRPASGTAAESASEEVVGPRASADVPHATAKRPRRKAVTARPRRSREPFQRARELGRAERIACHAAGVHQRDQSWLVGAYVLTALPGYLSLKGPVETFK